MPFLASFRILLLGTVCVWLAAQGLMAQRVGINTPNPDPSSVLDVTSTQYGFLPPRLSTAQRDAIAAPARGLMVYNTDTDCMEYWNGTQWISMCAASAPCVAPPAPAVAAAPNPACVGQTVTLTASPIAGATYVWTGPNGYYQTAQNPNLTNIAAAQAGTYTCRVFLAGCWSPDATVDVTVLPTPWTRKADFPAAYTARSGTSGFGIGGIAYVGTGRNGCGGTDRLDMFQYNPATDAWGTIAPCPSGTGVGKTGMTGFAIAGLGYMCGGNYNCGFTYRSCYRYNPATNTWTAAGTVANYPTTFSHSLNNLVANNLGYAIGGHCGSAAEGAQDCAVSCQTSTLRAYNPATNTWANLSAAPFSAPTGNIELSVGFGIGTRVFLGMGRKMGYSCSGARVFTEFFEYLPATNTWATRASIPGPGGSPFAYFAIGGYGYVVYPNRSVYQYDPTADAWNLLDCPFPGTIANEVYSVEINGKGYIFDLLSRETWEFTP